MSEKKEVEGGSKADDSKEKELVDEKKTKSKKGSTSKKAKQNNAVEETNDDSKEPSSSEKETTAEAPKTKKASKKSKETQNGDEEQEELDDDVEVKKKIPLLDQPPIIEGSRVRTCVLKPPAPEPKQVVDVPAGKGKPLGKIPIVNQRLKRLRITTIKNLHRLIFGRIGKISLVLSNIQKFKGFPFAEDSDDYNRKATALNKLHMDELKELVFSFDLDMKLKKKDECAKEILNFLVSPKTSEKTQNAFISHPKRKATKRNYFDADVDDADNKKRKKPKPAAEAKKEKSSEDDEAAKTTAKSSKANEKSPKADEASEKNDDQDNSNELKKPAKKRKRNQIIEEEDNKKTKQDEKSDGEEDESEEGNAATAASDSQSPKKNASKKDKLSDEELTIFLKRVLADLNLENTTMKTVYNLISSEYPTYDFSQKKRFIKGVVKSLIQ
ncbi:protein DEK-like isoform X2 [Planococcus citri]